MLKNYLTIAFRSFWRNKGNSLINVFGLSLGIACCLLISLFVYDEWTFDTFHSKADRIYRVYARENWGEGQDFFYTVTPFPMGPTLKANFPEVDQFVRLANQGTRVKQGSEMFNEPLTIGDKELFEVFDFPMIKGERSGVLSGSRNVVISEEIAAKYFGTSDPIGKPMELLVSEEFEPYTVTGVVRIPRNSSIQFSILINEENLTNVYGEQVLTSAWFNIVPETYVLLKEKVTAQSVMDKFPKLFRSVLGDEEFEQSKYEPGLQPLTSIHLDPSYPVGYAPVSDPKYSYILVAIALTILFVACINFVTLSVGRSLNRAKEVGVRKVVGAMRYQLITQFLGEALLVTLISLIVGAALSVVALPVFNDLSGKQLIMPLGVFPVSVMLVLLVVIGFVAGSYPAFLLSQFKPISMLRGSLVSGNSKQGIRKVLVSVQLVLAIFLITSTLIMQNQLSFLRNKNLGFNKEQLAVIRMNVPGGGGLAARVQAGFDYSTKFKTEYTQVPGVVSVCAASHEFARGNWTNVGFTDDQGTYRTFYMNVVDSDYINTMQMTLVSGRDFDAGNPSDVRRGIIVNEALVKSYGWTDAIGKRLPGKRFGDHEIIGVVRDFNFASLYTTVQPLVMVQNFGPIMQGVENTNIDGSPMPKLFVRIEAADIRETVARLQSAWEKLTDGEEFVFSFVDASMDAQYANDKNLGRIVQVATGLAILIATLGLYGLATLTMQNRTREISIRKVLGATEASLMLLLSREYVLLIVISLALSVPLTIYAMNEWLKGFAYRITPGADAFLLAGGITLCVAMLTISYETIRRARTKPVEALKSE